MSERLRGNFISRSENLDNAHRQSLVPGRNFLGFLLRIFGIIAIIYKKKTAEFL